MCNIYNRRNIEIMLNKQCKAHLTYTGHTYIHVHTCRCTSTNMGKHTEHKSHTARKVGSSLLVKVLILIEPLAEVLDPEVSHEVDLAIEQSQ